MGPNKYIHLTFAIAILVLSFLIYKTGDWVWSYFGKTNDLVMQGSALLIGVMGGLIAYKNDRVFATASDVTKELEKVTWPTRKETYYATIVVIVTVIISTLVLSMFDGLWSFLSGRILK
jgi:preprotein translocase subunit SecE